MGGMFGGKTKTTPAQTFTMPTMTTGQLGLLDQITGFLNGKIGTGVETYGPDNRAAGASPLQEMAYSLLGDTTSGDSPYNTFTKFTKDYDPSSAKAFYEDSIVPGAMKNWKQRIVPGIAEKFAGAGATNSSGFYRALTDAGENMNTDLSGTLGNLVYQGEQAHKGFQLQGATGLERIMQEILGAGGVQQQTEQNQLTGKYQDWMQGRPENNPWLQYLFPSLQQKAFENVVIPPTTTQSSGGGFGSILGGVGSILGAIF